MISYQDIRELQQLPSGPECVYPELVRQRGSIERSESESRI